MASSTASPRGHRRPENAFRQRSRSWRGAYAARDALLAQLGFTGVVFSTWTPEQGAVRRSGLGALQRHRANGRLIGFIYPGDLAEADGGKVFVGDIRIDASVTPRCSPRDWPTQRSTTPCARTYAAALVRCPGPRRPPPPFCGSSTPPTRRGGADPGPGRPGTAGHRVRSSRGPAGQRVRGELPRRERDVSPLVDGPQQ